MGFSSGGGGGGGVWSFFLFFFFFENISYFAFRCLGVCRFGWMIAGGFYRRHLVQLYIEFITLEHSYSIELSLSVMEIHCQLGSRGWPVRILPRFFVFFLFPAVLLF